MEFHWLVLLRVVHVASAAVWFGTVVFGAFFLAPTLASAGESGKGFMAAVARRGGFGRFMGPVALTTLVAGGLLYWQMGYLRAPFATVSSTLLTLGALLATAGWLFGTLATAPLHREVRAIGARAGAAGPDPQDAARLQQLQGAIARRTRVVGPVVALAFLLMVGRALVA